MCNPGCHIFWASRWNEREEMDLQFSWTQTIIQDFALKISWQIAGLCEAEEDRFPRREVLGAGRGRPDVGHGLHARRQAHRQRSQHAPQGESMFKYCQKIMLSNNCRAPDKLWCSRQLFPKQSEKLPPSSSTPTSSSRVRQLCIIEEIFKNLETIETFKALKKVYFSRDQFITLLFQWVLSEELAKMSNRNSFRF